MGPKRIRRVIYNGHFPSSSDRIFSRMASMMNSDRLRYARSGLLEIRRSMVAIISSGIATVVYPFTMHTKYIRKRLDFVSNLLVMYHKYNIIARY